MLLERIAENGGSLVNGDGGLQKRGRRPEGLCRVVLERMARIGCGTTEAAVGWNWLPLLVAGWENSGENGLCVVEY